MKTQPHSNESHSATRRELRQLHFRLVTTRVRMLMVLTTTGFARAGSLLIGTLTGEIMLDWLVHLPWLARASFSLPALAGAAWILYKEVLKPLMRMPNDHAMACYIERALPVFETRLIASIQLAGQSRSNALVGALVRETAAMAAKEDFKKVVKARGMFRELRLLICVVLVAGFMAWLGRANLVTLIERSFLLTTHLPTMTRIEKIDFPAKIPAGNDVKIDVQTNGVQPPEGMVLVQVGPNLSEYRLERDPAGKGKYHAVIRGVTASLSFHVHLNDVTSDPVKVTVLAPPVVVRLDCEEQFPAYAKLPPAPRATGDLSLLAGSMLNAAITSSSPLKEGSLHLVESGTDLALTIDPQNRLIAHGQIPIPKSGLSGFSVRMTDENGIESRETAVYHIDSVPDRPPAIKILSPSAQDLATASATEQIAFEAEDDYGVAKVYLHYIINKTPEKIIEFDLGGETPRSLQRRFDWKLAPMQLAPGSSIEFWMDAADANTITGPGTGSTEHAQIRIVTDDEKRSELLSRMNDALGALNGMSQNEDELAKKVGKQVLQKPDEKPQ